MEVADAVDWDEYVAVGSGGIVGRAIVKGAAAIADGVFLKHISWKSLDKRGKNFRTSEPIPQNLTANTDSAPNPETAPKFFIHPPILERKLMFGASRW